MVALLLRVLCALSLIAAAGSGDGTSSHGPFGDYRDQSPGTKHFIRPADLPPPYATKSTDNGPKLIPRPPDAWPKAPPGFNVERYDSGLDNPRLIRAAP